MNLKGVYVNLSSMNLGVNYKVKAITNALNSYDGVSFLLVIPSFKQQKFTIIEKSFKQLELGIYSNNKLLFCFEKLFLKFFPVKFIRKWKFKNLFFKALLNYQIDNDISFSILRYPFANISLHNFIKKSSSKVFLEFNTFEIDEFKSQNVLYFFNSKYYLELLFRKKILKNSNGIIGVTLAGTLGFILAKSMHETNGFFWAWVIHFLQDVLIIGTMFLMNENTSS